MKNALSITFKDTKHTDHLIQFIENKFKRLKKMNSKLIQCSVVVTTPHKQHRTGNSLQVTIHAQIPGKEITAKRFTRPQEGVDLYAAISDAFFTIELQSKPKGNAKVTFKNFRKLSYLDAHCAG